jgi:hypothetical protein
LQVYSFDPLGSEAYRLEVTFETAPTVPLIEAEQRALANIYNK